MNPARSSSSRALVAVLVVVAVLVAFFWYAGHRGGADPSKGAVGSSTSTSADGGGSATPTPDSGLSTIDATTLPKAARDMLVLIHAGGPFKYTEDGQTFDNREGILPKQKNGYYKEYTVKAGSSGDRGPLRIIGGRSGDLYWTSDHYAHFQQIKEGNP